MLGHTFRLRASNTQNQNITVTATARYWKFATDGSITWSAEQTLISAVSVAATTGTTASSAVDNSSDKWLGMTISAAFTAASATNGTNSVLLTLERSTDGGTTWPTQDRGIFVGAEQLLAADSTNLRRRNYTFG
jgi:Ni/Fe-hydrogenase subunit HybB-like protein